MFSAESPTRHTRHSVGTHKAQGPPKLRELQGLGGITLREGSSRFRGPQGLVSSRLGGTQGLGATKAWGGPQVWGAPRLRGPKFWGL
jgi:hypothetical protein